MSQIMNVFQINSIIDYLSDNFLEAEKSAKPTVQFEYAGKQHTE